jgi:peptidoglycan hydrolase CwlO-like protein
MDNGLAIIIVGGLELLGVVVSVCWGNKMNAARSEEQTKITLYRIGELEKKQDKYNHLQERTYKDEQDIAVIKREISAINEKIDYLHGE